MSKYPDRIYLERTWCTDAITEDFAQINTIEYVRGDLYQLVREKLKCVENLLSGIEWTDSEADGVIDTAIDEILSLNWEDYEQG